MGETPREKKKKNLGARLAPSARILGRLRGDARSRLGECFSFSGRRKVFSAPRAEPRRTRARARADLLSARALCISCFRGAVHAAPPRHVRDTGRPRRAQRRFPNCSTRRRHDGLSFFVRGRAAQLFSARLFYRAGARFFPRVSVIFFSALARRIFLSFFPRRCTGPRCESAEYRN